MMNPDLGPLISAQQLNRVKGYVDQGIQDGAALITGGKPSSGFSAGHFYTPTIFQPAKDDLSIVEEEIFGPVVSVVSFEDAEEVTFRANNTPYGLAAAIWTNDIRKAHQLAHQIQAGTVWINGYDLFDAAVPFGGYKESGIGKEMGKNAIDLFTQEKAIWVSL